MVLYRYIIWCCIASAGAPCVAVEVEAMASATIFAPSKKPSMALPIAAGTSPFVG